MKIRVFDSGFSGCKKHHPVGNQEKNKMREAANPLHRNPEGSVNL